MREGCIKRQYDKAEGIVTPARSVGWRSNEAVSLLYLVPWASTLTYRVKHKIRNIPDSHH